ncbi:MAG: hypothetical protein RLZZ546_2234 [Bacteroidota bacterium]|jgi:hypothetical protein
MKLEKQYRTNEITKKPAGKFAMKRLLPMLLNFDKLIVYPNPASDKLNLISKQDVQLNIISGNGSVIMTIKAIKGLNSIDVSNLPSGLYILKSNNDSIKFIKQ